MSKPKNLRFQKNLQVPTEVKTRDRDNRVKKSMIRLVQMKIAQKKKKLKFLINHLIEDIRKSNPKKTRQVKHQVRSQKRNNHEEGEEAQVVGSLSHHQMIVLLNLLRVRKSTIREVKIILQAMIHLKNLNPPHHLKKKVKRRAKINQEINLRRVIKQVRLNPKK